MTVSWSETLGPLLAPSALVAWAVRAGGPIDPARVRVLAFDLLPGRDDDAVTITTADQARLLALLLDAQGEPRIDAFVGSSYGSCNHLAEGGAFVDALTAARDAGFAEADPSADLTGLDAAAKLAILAHEGLGRSLRIEDVSRQTLAADAVLPAGRVRQIARLDVASGQTGVAFEAVDGDALFANLPDEANALRVRLADSRIFTATGRGAGRRPTAESVWADLEDLIEAR